MYDVSNRFMLQSSRIITPLHRLSLGGLLDRETLSLQAPIEVAAIYHFVADAAAIDAVLIVAQRGRRSGRSLGPWRARPRMHSSAVKSSLMHSALWSQSLRT